MKILEYKIIPLDIKTGNCISFQVYDLYQNGKTINTGYFHSRNEMWEYIEKNNISDFFDMTFRSF